jgi:glutamate/tyrosine decarboxylase-like PLP-dependent enzyme
MTPENQVDRDSEGGDPVFHDPLAIDPETMRALGYQTIDLLIERASREREQPTLRSASREEMEIRLHQPAPSSAVPFDQILERLRADVLPFMGRFDHPRFFGFIPGSGTWPGALGDLVASACNIDASSWREASGPSQLELVVLDWFKDWIGYPKDTAGVLVSGGSAANMTALACAREALLGPMSGQVTVYMSDQAHSSMARAARILGFRPEQVRILPSDDSFRLDPQVLTKAMDADVKAGLQPMLVAAAAGSTSTGAVDPVSELSEICRNRGIWLHVDAAYGGFAVLSERGKEWLAGLELADSVTLDPHKWLYQPFECGCLLVREGWLLRKAFEITPDYLRDSQAVSREVNFGNLGMQLTRMTRALKVWMSLSYFGLDAFRQAIDRSIDLAVMAEQRIARSNRLEVLSPASLGVVCFRRSFREIADDHTVEHMNSEVVRKLVQSGKGLVSSTRLRGQFAIRLCVMNHNSTAEDVEAVLNWIEEAVVEPPAATSEQVEPDGREQGTSQRWLRSTPAYELNTIPIFKGLDAEQLRRVASVSREYVVPAGQSIVSQWEFAREFYVILEGKVSVRSGGRELRRMGPGEFFGELAALDWGAGYGYPRTASVTSQSQVRVLVLPGIMLNELAREDETFGAAIRAAMKERLPRR